MILCIVCNKPIDEAQTDFRRSLQDLEDLSEVLAIIIESLETGYDEFLFAVDLLATCLHIMLGVHGGKIIHFSYIVEGVFS